MFKEYVVHIYNGILLSHINNEIGSFAMMWMDLESVTQTGVNQKDKYRILTHISGI